jgi:cytoplasmic iron level regulating protein YaaA (DUF328/UPF0246 family)
LKPTITKALNKVARRELFVNLASTEYFSAVKALKVPVVTPSLKIIKWKIKIISFFAKRREE